MKKPIYYGYILTLIATVIIAVSFGTLYCFGLFLEPLISEFGWTKATISGAYSVSFILHGFMYIITGRINDRVGPKMVVRVCCIIMGFAYILMGWINAVWHLYLIYGVALAIAMGGIYVPLVSTLARWFVKKLGLMTGIVVSGVGFGTMLLPLIVRWLIATYEWRVSYVILGVLILLLLVPVTQFLRQKPEDLRLLAYGSGEKLKRMSHGSEAPAMPLRDALLTREFWIFCGTISCFVFAQQVILVHIASHAAVLGLSATIGANILSIIGGSSIVGRMTIGALTDKIGNKRSLTFDIALLLSAFLWLPVVKEVRMLYLFGSIFGFSYGGLVAMMSPIVAELFGLASHGVILGTLSFIATAGGAVGPVVAGYLFDITGAYTITLFICAAFVTVSFVLAIILWRGRESRLSLG
ncbi:MAG TPA: MFS transporter [Desulfatiglandales bacterium]|nr:MFS transporter [Desulfatiglandales bacterium]